MNFKKLRDVWKYLTYTPKDFPLADELRFRLGEVLILTASSLMLAVLLTVFRLINRPIEASIAVIGGITIILIVSITAFYWVYWKLAVPTDESLAKYFGKSDASALIWFFISIALGLFLLLQGIAWIS